MALTVDQVKRIKAMKHDDLIANAQSEDFAVVVEASLRLHSATKALNVSSFSLALSWSCSPAPWSITREFQIETL